MNAVSREAFYRAAFAPDANARCIRDKYGVRLIKTVLQKMFKLHPLLLLAFLLSGCDRTLLDHKIVTSNFEDSIKLVWGQGADAGSWTFEIPDPMPHGHQAMYALYLYDGNKKHFMIGAKSRLELPYQDAGTSHDELSPKTLHGGWFLWIDYELYSSDGELLLKGCKLSEPSPKQNKPATKPN